MEAPPTEKDTRWVSFSKQYSRNFTFGEYSHTLRLASEPHIEKPWLRVRGIDIRLIYREYGGRHCLRRMRTGSRAQARGARSMKREASPTEKDTRWVSFSKQNSRNFTFGEYSRTLRLASELADLRVANADRIPRAGARGTVDKGGGASKAKEHPDGMLFCFGGASRNRTGE